MDFIIYTLVVTAAICLIIIVIAKITNSGKPQQNNLTKEQTLWLQKVGKLFWENKAMPFLDVYVECGMPNEIAYSKDVEAINQAFPFEKDETKHDGYDVFCAYQFAISQRYNLQNNQLQAVNPDRYGLNLQKNEVIYHRINYVTFLQEKTTRYNLIYSGVRWQSGLLQAGSMSVIGNEITRFTAIDIGRLFITNQRIIFTGKQKNVTKSISIEDILYYNLYQDGVLINIPNKKPILLKFEIGYDAEILHVHDGLNEFVTVINRILSGSKNQNLAE